MSNVFTQRFVLCFETFVYRMYAIAVPYSLYYDDIVYLTWTITQGNFIIIQRILYTTEVCTLYAFLFTCRPICSYHIGPLVET